MAFQRPYPLEPERKAVVNYLRKRADEFRKNREKVPFLTSEKWRAKLFPKTSVSKIYRGPGPMTTIFKIKDMPLVTLQTEESMDYTSESDSSSFKGWEETEPVDIGDQGTIC